MDPLILLLASFVLATGLALLAHRIFPVRYRRPPRAFARHQHTVECNTPLLDRPDGFMVKAELAPGQEVRLIQSRHFANGPDTRLWHEVETGPAGWRGWVREDALLPSNVAYPADEIVFEPSGEELAPLA